MRGDDKFPQQPRSLTRPGRLISASVLISCGDEPSILAPTSPPPPSAASLCAPRAWRRANPRQEKRGLFQKPNARRIPTLPGGPRLPCEDFQNQIFKQKHTNLFPALSVEKTRGEALMEMFHFFCLPTDAKRAARISRFASLVALLI